MLCLRSNIFCSIKQGNSLIISTLPKSCQRKFCSPGPQNLMTQRQPRRFKDIPLTERIGPGGWFLLLVPVSTFCLGTWQVKRKKWKEELIENLLAKSKLPAVPLPMDDNEVKNLNYRKVVVRGEFDHSGEMYLGPRSLLLDGESTYHGKLMSAEPNNSSGYLVITPFILSDTNERILVNRGWVSFKQKQPKTRLKGQVTGKVVLEGIVRLTEPRPMFGLPNKPDVRVWFFRDVESMAKSVDCRPVFIDATVESTVEGGPIGGQTRVSMRNEHFSYILTWYALSISTGFMWYSKYLR